MTTRHRMTALAAATAITASLLAASPAHAAEPDWQRVLTGPAGEPTAVYAVAAAPAGDSYALVSVLRPGEPFAQLHGIDPATGSTTWTLEEGIGHPGYGAASLATDAATGSVVVSSWAPEAQRYQLTSVTPDGRVAWTVLLPDGALLDDLVVDETTGTVCASGIRWSFRRWSTGCWTREGAPLFEDTWDARSRSGGPDRVEVDGRRDRVLVTGTRQVRGELQRVALAYRLDGTGAWRDTRPLPYGSRTVDLTIDEDRGTAVVLTDVRRRALVETFRIRDGKKGWTRTFGSRRSKDPRPRAIDVLPASHRVVVTSQAPKNGRTKVRLFTGNGRPTASRTLGVCCELAGTDVDVARDRVVLTTGRRFGSGYDDGAHVSVLDKRGNVMSNERVVEKGILDKITATAYDPASGTLVLGTGALTEDDTTTGWLAGVVLR